MANQRFQKRLARTRPIQVFTCREIEKAPVFRRLQITYRFRSRRVVKEKPPRKIEESSGMKCRMWLAGLIVFFSCVTSARADTGVIVRTTNLPALQALCLLPTTCTLVGSLDGSLGQLFLVTTPLPLADLLGLLNGVLGFVDAEVDQILDLVGGLNVVPTLLDPTLMSDRTPVVYPQRPPGIPM
jgi:hypothetical protein